MRNGRLLWKIYVYFLSAIVIALSITTWHAAQSLQTFYEKQVSNDLMVRAMIVAREISSLPLEAKNESLQKACKELKEITAARITIILPNGRVIADSDETPDLMDKHSSREEIAVALKGETGKSKRFSQTLNRKLKYVAVPIRHNDEIIAVTRLAMPLADIRWNLREISMQLLFAGIITALFLGAIALYLSRRLSRPLEEMRKSAERIAAGDLSARVEVEGSDETSVLARTFNQMAKQMDERLNTIARQRGELKTILAGMAEGLIAINTEERIIQINKAAGDLLDIQIETATGRSVQEAIRNHELQNFLLTTLGANSAVHTEIISRGTKERYLQTHGAALKNEKGERFGAVIIINDISKLKLLEKVRSDFVANVSHELKTPLSAMKGCVEALTGTPPPDEEDTKRFTLMISRHVDRMTSIIEDLLNLARLEFETEQSDTQFLKTSIYEMLNRTIQNFIKQAEARNITLKLDCPENLLGMINETLIEQAVGNLIDNAIKYSAADTNVIIKATHIENHLNISVSDQGIGIEKKHLARIFERFYRADHARSRSLGGTGLGLSIVKHIAMIHNGSAKASSVPGQGSTFTISVPGKPI